jgi:hypothetical protein
VLPLTWNIFPSVNGGIVTGALWNWGDGSSSNSMFPSHTYSAAGVYSICLSVTVSCASGTTTASYCSSSSIYKMAGGNAVINVRVIDPSNPLGISNQAGLAGLRIYPNPSNGIFRLENERMKNEAGLLKVTDILGKEIYSAEWNGSDLKEINLSDVPSGTYFIKVTSGESETNSRIIIFR